MHAPADAQLSAARLGPCQHSGSVPAIHSWVFRNCGVPQPDGEDFRRGAHGLARRPRRPKAAERRPLAPADPGALALRRRSAPPRPPSGRPGARTPCGRARRGRAPAAPPRAARWRPYQAEPSAAPVRLPPLPSAALPAAADSEARSRGTQRGRGSDAPSGRGGGEHGPSTPPPPAGPSLARARPRQPTFEFEV